MKETIVSKKEHLEEVSQLNKLCPQESWLPITESRNGNAFFLAFHTLRGLPALVYEYMENGSLDRLLFHEHSHKLHEIAVGTAKGIAYLHEYCQQRIIHYDIKPANIHLDANFCPKVSDFGLAKLCNRENMEFKKGQFQEVMVVCVIEEDKQKADRLTMADLSCFQYRQELRPWMNAVIFRFACFLIFIAMSSVEGIALVISLNSYSCPLKPAVVIFAKILIVCMVCHKRAKRGSSTVLPDSRFLTLTMNKFLNDMEREKPIRFSSQQLRIATDNFNHLLGSEISTPTNPFEHLLVGVPYPDQHASTTWSGSGFDSVSSQMLNGSSVWRSSTPVMRKYEIEIASA
ncbi:hypothetical protein HHK36_021124 [Tetracentron sinense]|uniref:Protein kinase domain-containing protein n=1 Tax=Tetracentron sinense TaxID=13715 RepID=A0A834YRI6_TETSI|nr:hypothetical protein HHK36_021124 [Tetracentron sinense]